MFDSMTFGDALTVLSIVGGIGAVLWKIGRKDAQFEAALLMLTSHADRIEKHDSDFDSLRQIISELGKMQAVKDRDIGHHEIRLNDLVQRIVHLEQSRKKSLTET